MSKNRRKTKTHPLKGQITYSLRQLLRIGESKYEAKQAAKKARNEMPSNDKSKKGGLYTDYIYSWSTYETYKKRCHAFAKWAKEKYGCRNLSELHEYIEEFIQYQIERGLSPSTIKTDISAICKLFRIHSEDLNKNTPSRHREDITRSRGYNPEDHKVHYKKNKRIIDFTRGTGLRRHELKKALVKDVYEKDGSLYIHTVGKGGRPREALINPDFEDHIKSCIKGLNKNERIFQDKEIKNKIELHYYRAEYACLLYKKFARDVKDIPKKERYICRADKAGVIYDKVAMLKVSQNLGHNRINVIASNYLYQL